MRPFKTDIIIFSGLVIFSLMVLLLTAGQSTVDIQLHDTYFIIDKVSMIFLLVGPLTFLIFLARGLVTKFKTKGANIGLIIGLILIVLITYQIILVQQNFRSEMMLLDDEGLRDRGQFIADLEKKITWTWGLFSFLSAGLLLLTFRTVKIWKEY